jgi:hypothetical protein
MREHNRNLIILIRSFFKVHTVAPINCELLPVARHPKKLAVPALDCNMNSLSQIKVIQMSQAT